MRSVRVKFCGITNFEDAAFAVDLGVNALGFVFYEKSPRYIAPEDARTIIDALPPFVSAVGLFVNESEEHVRAATDRSRIDTIQFHGEESPAFCAKFDHPWIKAIHLQQSADLADAESAFADASALLIDTYDPDLYGGTGRTFNWDLVGDGRKLPLILAGGLGSENVAQAIERVCPYAVDVSGGIERRKGLKDKSKMTAFMNVVRELDGTN